MKRIAPLLILFALLSACGTNVPLPATATSTSDSTLTIFAAASLTEAFREMATLFETSHPGVNVSLNFAGSNTLRAQIDQGAQADLFASANTKEMDALIASGLVAENTAQTFLNNRLVVITPAKNPAALSTFDDLTQPNLKLVLAAEEVPVGRYTRLMLENAGADFSEKMLVNLVSNENNVKQVVAKVQLGEADAGIVYASDAVAAPELIVIEIPTDFNVLATYPIAPLVDAPHPQLAQEFVAFVLSAEGQALLEKWGFTPAP